MDDWRRRSVSELGTIFDGPHATPTRINDGPYFLNIASLQSGRLDLESSDHVSEDDFMQWTRRVTPAAGDLLFAYETRLGEAALMPPDVRACLGRRMALLRPDRDVIDPRFLLYCYLGPAFQRTIAMRTIHGATVPRIGLASMPNWDIEIPGLPEQRAIGEVLGALDDKIAANDQVIESIDGLLVSHASAAHVMTTVSDLAAQGRRSLRPAEFDAEIAHFSLPAFDAGRWPESSKAADIKSNKFQLLSACVLVSKLNPRIPRVWDVTELSQRMAVASTEFVVLEPIEVSSSALWAALQQPSTRTELAGLVAGTSGSHQRVKPAEIMKLSVPDPRALSPHNQHLIAALGASRHGVAAESRVLGATRDELLPLLMTGKVRVREAEKVVEEIV